LRDAIADAGVHEHTHTLAFERYTYLLSPVHALDPRAKILAAFAMILGIVLTPPLAAIEFALLVALLAAVVVLSGVPLRAVLGRSLLVLPVAGTIALFAPLAAGTGSWSVGAVGEAYSSGWIVAWGIISKAWLSTLVVLIVAATTPPPLLFAGMRRLGLPQVFVTMLTFLYRFNDAFVGQLRSMRRAIASRGYEVRGRQLVVLYGNLAGNLFIRSYERGERIYAAMLSRGFDGTLPVSEPLKSGPADVLVVALALVTVAALVLY
jgi:cobalt/nickel transport system permease protein